jgi:hypothetical protein
MTRRNRPGQAPLLACGLSAEEREQAGAVGLDAGLAQQPLVGGRLPFRAPTPRRAEGEQGKGRQHRESAHVRCTSL